MYLLCTRTYYFVAVNGLQKKIISTCRYYTSFIYILIFTFIPNEEYIGIYWQIFGCIVIQEYIFVYLIYVGHEHFSIQLMSIRSTHTLSISIIIITENAGRKIVFYAKLMQSSFEIVRIALYDLNILCESHNKYIYTNRQQTYTYDEFLHK